MEDIFKDFVKTIKVLEEKQIDYVLVGGFAVILHGFPRLTQDMDLVVKMIPDNIEKLRDALSDVFEDQSAKEISFNDLKEYSVIRYGTPGGFIIDVIANIGEMIRFEDLKFETIHYEGLKIRVATPETLIKMKKDTLREKDRIDVGFLHDLIRKSKGQNQ